MSRRDSPIKILHLVDSLGAGGLENGVANVANLLDPEEFDIHACCLTQRGVFAERMPDPKQVWAIGKQEGFSYKWVSAVRKQIKEIKPDVLHTHNLGPLIYGALASRLGRSVPIVQGEHSQLKPRDLEPRHMKQRKILHRACAKIHTVAQEMVQNYADWGIDTSRFEVVRNGVDCDRFCPAEDKGTARKELGLDMEPGGVLLGIVGRMSEFKGHLPLLEAFDRLSERGVNVRLVIVGDGGTARDEVLKRFEESPFPDRIHWAGVQMKPEFYFRAMDLMVLPSTHEGMANVVIESMGCGTPVLGAQACGNEEMIMHLEDGFLEHLETAGDLVDSLERILADPEKLSRMGERARTKIENNFSIDHMVSGYRKLYLETIQQSMKKAV